MKRSRPEMIRRARRWLLGGTGWLLVAVLIALQNYVAFNDAGKHATLEAMLRREAPLWIVWWLASPGIHAMTRRLPLGGKNGWRNLLLHLPIGFCVNVVMLLAYVGIVWGLGWIPDAGLSYSDMVRRAFFNSFVLGTAIYCVVATGFQAIDLYRALRDRELSALALEARLAEARLDVLKMQLQPHFLFNTLHGISALMMRDVRAARGMIARLSDLLRLSLDEDSAQEVPLDRELAFLDRYLDLQRMRFPDRLHVETSVEESARSVPVPRLVLQPIVENAIRHGIARHARGGRVSVDARVVEGRLRITVADDGPGIAGDRYREGVGIANTRARLRLLYGEEGRFDIRNGATGAIARITIPAREPVHARDDADAAGRIDPHTMDESWNDTTSTFAS